MPESNIRNFSLPLIPASTLDLGPNPLGFPVAGYEALCRSVRISTIRVTGMTLTLTLTILLTLALTRWVF